MSAPTPATYPQCPCCGSDLRTADVAMGEGVSATHDPEGIARFELLLSCFECEAEFYAFVPVSELIELGGGE